MKVHAHAPGKLILLGEYAVLEGAPSLITAVNRRAHATVTRSSESVIRVSAPQLPVPAFELTRTSGNGWGVPNSEIKDADLVLTILNGLAIETAADLSLDSSAFFDQQQKLGLGSSAALCVALVTALSSDEPELGQALQLHRAFQDGRGSGADIATSFHGGVIRFQTQDQKPDVQKLDWPNQLHWRTIWTGNSFSTRDSLHRLAAWRDRASHQYQRQFNALCQLARDGELLFAHGDGAVFQEVVADYANELNRLGRQSDIDIISEVHAHALKQARAHNITYKPSGAGGGDFGIAFSDDPEKLDQWLTALPQPIQYIALQSDPTGVLCEHV